MYISKWYETEQHITSEAPVLIKTRICWLSKINKFSY